MGDPVPSGGVDGDLEVLYAIIIGLAWPGNLKDVAARESYDHLETKLIRGKVLPRCGEAI